MVNKTPGELYKEQILAEKQGGGVDIMDAAVKTKKKQLLFLLTVFLLAAGAIGIVAVLGLRQIATEGSAKTGMNPLKTREVLSEQVEFYFRVNSPSFFKNDVTFEDIVNMKSDLTVEGDAVFNQGLSTNNQNIDAGTGIVIAANIPTTILGGITAGSGMSVTGGLTPTIANTGVLSLQGSTGALSLTSGDGISLSGLAVTNSDRGSSQNIFKTIAVSGQDSITAGSNTETLTFLAGSGISVTTNAATKTVSILSTVAGTSQWTTTGSDIYYNAGNVGIGTTLPAEALDVTGNIRATGSFIVGSSVGISVASPSCVTAVGGIVTGTATCSGSGTGGSLWAELNGAISPYISNLDVLIGSNASSSAMAKFGATPNSDSFFNSGGNVGIGTSVPTSKFQVDGSVTGKALVNLNEIGDQDIFTASSSGMTKFVIKNDGTIGLDNSLYADCNLGTDSSGNITCGAPLSASVTVVKSEDESVTNSDVLQDDDELTFAVNANETWEFTFNLQYTHENPNLLKFTITSPGGVDNCVYSFLDQDNNTSLSSNFSCGSEVTIYDIYAGNGNTTTLISGSIKNGATPGNVTLQWAQDSSDATPVTIYKGSTLVAHKVGNAGEVANAWQLGGNSFAQLGTIGTNDAYDFALKANSTEVLRLTTGGNVGIGTTGPLAKLDIKDSTSLAVVGSEMISTAANQTFASDTGDWTGSNWSISGDVGVHTAGNSVFTLSNTALTSSPVAGRYYQVTFDVTTTTSGLLYLSIGGASGSYVGQEIGTLTSQVEVLQAANGTALSFNSDGDWEGSIDNVSVKEITPSSIALRLESSDGTDTPLEMRGGGSGLSNTFIGQGAGQVNVSGNSNTAVGALSLASNIDGGENTALGVRALSSNTTGWDNNAFGFAALSSNTVSSYNNAFGDNALYAHTTGDDNSAFGSSALGSHASGERNSAMGAYALSNNITGSYNTALGYGAGGNNESGSGNVFLGYRAGRNETGSNRLYIANSDTTDPLIFGDFAASSLGINTSLTGDGALVVNQSKGTGDIFAASSSATTRFVIKNDGNVGIGTTTPEHKFQLVGTTNQKALSVINGDGNQALFTASSSGSTKFLIDKSGNVGIGVTNPDSPLFVKQTTVLGSSAGNYQRAMSLEMTTVNQVFNHTWLYRDGNGTDWANVSIYDGISIDSSYGTPTDS